MDYLQIVSDACTNLISETFKEFCRKVDIQQSTRSSYHQSNDQVEACVKFVKCTINKCLDTNQDISLTLLKIYSTPVGAGLPSPVTVLFKGQIRGLLPQMNREPININNDDTHYKVL